MEKKGGFPFEESQNTDRSIEVDELYMKYLYIYIYICTKYIKS